MSYLAQSPPPIKLVLRPVLGVIAIAVVAYLLGVDFGPLDGFMARWAVLVLEVGAAICCIARAVSVAEERRAWTLLAIAVSLWALGDLIWRVVYYSTAQPPALTAPDVLWLGFYGFACAGVVLLMRERARQADTAIWLDGLVAALAMAALASAIVLRAVLDQTGDPTFGTAINFSYVLADAILVGLVLVAFALTGWRLDRAWAWLGGALAVFAISDSAYLYETAQGAYEGGGLLDAGWGFALLLIGIAAWHTGDRRPAVLRDESWRSIALPIAFGFLALAIEVFDHFTRVTALAMLLATACLALVFARLALTFAQYLRVLRTTREQATTDALTGLANRRQLVIDLQDALSAPTQEQEQLLLLLDLDDFKAYNDTLGHSAGDALLERLGSAFAHALAPWGRAYRMGGDEFCALLRPEGRPAAELTALARLALSEPEAAMPICSSAGWALIPAEANDPSSALRLADRRMYADKERQPPRDRRTGPRSVAAHR